jgi:hypothetical protein
MGERKGLAIRPTPGWRHAPMCYQCGEKLTGRTQAQKNRDHAFHEVADDTTLKFRLFATSSDPEENGPVGVQCSSEGIAFGWLEPSWPQHRFTWGDLFAVIQAARSAGIELANGSEVPHD